MTKINKILLILMILSKNLLSDNLAPDVSFLDLPLSAKTGALGNTYLSDIGSPINLFLNPSNIWYGEQINISRNYTKKYQAFKKIYPRISLTNFKIIDSNNNFNLMMNWQYGDIITVGLGYIENNQDQIEEYDANANYIGELTLRQRAFLIGAAKKIFGINIGASVGISNYNFSNLNAIINEDNVYISAIGLSMNDKYIKIKREHSNNPHLERFIKMIPHRLSFHITSKNIFYKNSFKNGLYKNIIGIKCDYLINDDILYAIFDYNSNNGITNSQISSGIGYEYSVNQKCNQCDVLNFSIGVKDLINLEGLSYGIEYKRNKDADFSISIANVNTAWNDDYTIVSFKYSFDKK